MKPFRLAFWSFVCLVVMAAQMIASNAQNTNRGEKNLKIRIDFQSARAVVDLTAIRQIKTEKKEVLEKIELQNLSNKLALEMGLAVVELAKSRNQIVAVEISRLNQTVFLYIGDGLPMDKHNWLRRKANVVKQLEQSSLSVKNDLKEENMTLETIFRLNGKDFVARGGSIPIFVKDVGMVAIITVSGLHDEEDHKIIVDALKGKYF